MYPQHHQPIQHQQQQLYSQHQQQHIQHHHNQQYIQHQQPQYSQYSQAPLLHHPAHYENSSIAYPYPQQLPPQQLHHPQQQPSSSLPLSPASSPESRGVKPKRKRATADQINRLNQVFEQTFFPTSDQRMDLAQELGMTPRTVQIWFQNKRQGWRSEHRRPVPREPIDEHNRM